MKLEGMSRRDLLTELCKAMYSHGWGGFTPMQQDAALGAMANVAGRMAELLDENNAPRAATQIRLMLAEK